MTSDIQEANRICQIHGVAHPGGIMHIAAATVPVGASFGLPPEVDPMLRAKMNCSENITMNTLEIKASE